MINVYIRCNSQGIIPNRIIRENEKVVAVLLDNNNTPIAHYGFDCKTDVKYIKYRSSNCKIEFSQTPNTIFEIVGSNCC